MVDTASWISDPSRNPQPDRTTPTLRFMGTGRLWIKAAVIMPWLGLWAACRPSEFVWQEPEDAPLVAYLGEFRRAVGGRVLARAPRAEVEAQLQSARVLWLGDYHPSERLHQLQRQLLARLSASGRPVVVVAEALATQDQVLLDRYRRGEFDLDTLRRRIRARWPDSWLDQPGLDPAFYRDLCELARRRGWPLYGLEAVPRPPLARRDAAIVARVQGLAAQHPEALVVVLVGQAHLAGAHGCVAASGLPAVAFGGEPPPELARHAASADGRLYRCAAGLWWFGELFTGPADATPPASAAGGR